MEEKIRGTLTMMKYTCNDTRHAVWDFAVYSSFISNWQTANWLLNDCLRKLKTAFRLVHESDAAKDYMRLGNALVKPT